MKNMKKIAALIAAQMLISAAPAVIHAAEPMNDVVTPFAFGEAYGRPDRGLSPAENIFYVEEQPFIMLDSAEDKDSSFFIYADTVYGRQPWYANQKFNPSSADKGILSVVLNTRFLDGTWTRWTDQDKKFPQSFVNYIDMNHVWLTEEGALTGACAEPYEETAGVTLLSLSELKKYSMKIGHTQYHYTYLRTGCKSDAGVADTKNFMLVLNTYGMLDKLAIDDGGGGVRPCFWIGEDFFTEVKLDVANMGTNVKRELLERYTLQEIKAAGYSDEELAAIGYKTFTEASIEGTLIPGYTLTAKHLEDGEYAWYRCDSATDAGTLIEGAAADTYTITNADAEKFLKFVVTNNGSETETLITQKVGAAVVNTFINNEVNKRWPQPEKTPDENVFYIDGRKFIYLENFGETSYIYADEEYVKRPFWGGSQKFTPDSAIDPGQSATWMQKAFLYGGDNAITFPKSITDNLEYHEWLTEGGAVGGACPSPYTFKAKIGLLSLEELRKYKDKIGYNTSNYRIMRTPSNVESGTMNLVCSCIDGVIRQIGVNDGNISIVPAVYIYNDFFKTNKLSLETTGSAVWDAICGMYKAKDLEGLYTKAELTQLGFYSSGEFEGTFKPGYTISIEGAGAGSGYNWYRCESAEDSGVLITSTQTKNYTLVNADGGKYIRAEVLKNGNVSGSYLSPKIDDALLNDIITDTDGGIPKDNPKENIFVIESDPNAKEFVLLDSDRDKKSSFFILNGEVMWNQPFYESQRFNPGTGDKGTVSYKLAHDVYEGTLKETVDGQSVLSGKNLPADIRTYIDADHEWLTEGGISDGLCPNDYLVKSPSALLSYAEARKYNGMFGHLGDNYCYLRTPSKTDKMKLLKTDAHGYYGQHWINNGGGIRPCFWIGEDFFRNVRLDVLKTGDNVKKALRNRYTKSEMAKIYDEGELAVLGYDSTTVTAYNISFTNEDGNEINELRLAGNTLNVAATVGCYAGDSPVTMIVALYDENGDMITAALDTAMVEKNAEILMSMSIDVSKFELMRGSSAKVYFWKSVESMLPIGDSITL